MKTIKQINEQLNHLNSDNYVIPVFKIANKQGINIKWAKRFDSIPNTYKANRFYLVYKNSSEGIIQCLVKYRDKRYKELILVPPGRLNSKNNTHLINYDKTIRLTSNQFSLTIKQAKNKYKGIKRRVLQREIDKIHNKISTASLRLQDNDLFINILTFKALKLSNQDIAVKLNMTDSRVKRVCNQKIRDINYLRVQSGKSTLSLFDFIPNITC